MSNIHFSNIWLAAVHWLTSGALHTSMGANLNILNILNTRSGPDKLRRGICYPRDEGDCIMIFILLSLPKLTECQLQERGIYLGPSFRVNIWLSHSILSLRRDTGPRGDDGTVTSLIFLFAPAINNFRQKSRLKAMLTQSAASSQRTFACSRNVLLIDAESDWYLRSSDKRQVVIMTKDLIMRNFLCLFVLSNYRNVFKQQIT